MLGLVLSLAIALNVQAQDQILTPEQTPKEINAYIQKYFPENAIKKVKKDIDGSKVEYEVKLSQRVELEFDESLKIKKVESKMALPKGIVSSAIQDYVLKNYPNMQIVQWERKLNGQEIELNNDIELYFDDKGNFIQEDR